MTDPQKIRRLIEREATLLGFDQIGISGAETDPELQDRLGAFLGADYHGSMVWMEETRERRASPKALWPDVKSIVMLAMNYGPQTNPLDTPPAPEKGAISVYARHRDYHDVMKGRLKTLASKLVSGTGAEVKVFVDTAPVMEKPLAQRAGLGWQGKHTNLVSREFGSWLFIGSIFTTLELPTDEAGTDNCGCCSACLDICPTQAFVAPYQIDARRCISYLTIENKGPVPVEFRKAMGNRIYGCDDCLAVCPWNKFARTATEAKLATPENPQPDDLQDFLELDDTAFRKRFSGSPVKRIGRNRFIRNCLIAAGNSASPNLLPITRKLCQEDDPMIAETAQWALLELEKS